MAIRAKALLGLSITILILSIIGLVINVILFAGWLGLAVSLLQIVVCCLGIAGSVHMNRVVLLIGTIGAGICMCIDIANLAIYIAAIIMSNVLTYLVGVAIAALYVGLVAALFGVFVHNTKRAFRSSKA